MSDKNTLVEPRTLKGFQDLLPEDVIARKTAVAGIEAVFAKYGFVPLETPALEHLDVLLGAGGEETNKELFRLETPEEEPIALRFDHTVPFARLLAQYPDRLKVPVRRWAVGPVWRADKPDPGRFREFTQLDVDVAGAQTVAVDAELVALMCEAMTAVGAPRFAVLINNRRLIDALLEGCGIDDAPRQKHVLRVIDKLAKVGVDAIRLELGEGRVDASGDLIPGVHLDAGTIERILGFIAVNGATRAAVVDAVEQALPESATATEALAEMRELDACLTALGIGQEQALFQPSLARGLDYYTGPVFEITLPDAPEFGSVGGGGRYNQLVERFLDRPIPCTGFSIGLDRLMAALKHLGAVDEAKSTTQA
ncbi:MAG TPA: histidine--tRNA ligase, partial [Candidatus Hydrogenedentes bacterium]|nr:histidine--tRNA ligase [Candidatus Hydrogenedentota bacterium]